MKRQDPLLLNFKLAIVKSGKKKSDVANAMGISNGHLSNLLKGRDTLSEDKKALLNKVLKTNF